MAYFFISRFRSSSFTQHGPRQQQQHRPQPVSTKMIAMAISIGAQLKKRRMKCKRFKKKKANEDSRFNSLIMFSSGILRILNMTRVYLTLISAIPPRTNHCFKSWSGVCTALFYRWERIVQTGRGLRR